MDRSTNTNNASFLHIEGDPNERCVLLHFLPGRSANIRILVPEPEVVVDSVEVETACQLIHCEVDPKKDSFTTEDLIGISDSEFGK